MADVDCCGSLNLAAPKFSSPEKAAAAAVTKNNNMNKGKQIVDVEEETQFAEDIQGCSDDMQEDGDYMQEDEVDSESDEECELNQRLIDLKKRKRGASHQFYEDEEVEDIFCDSDGSDDASDCLDDCFIKLSTRQHILCATGRDGNNNLFLVAFGFVDKEETATWSWFLTQLKYALGGEAGKFGYYTIISDRQKGLLNAINQIFPNCPQRYCLRHIYANVQTAGFRGEELKKYMDAASYSYTQHGFDVAMANMKEECLEAWEWLMKITVASWARYAIDYNCKTDLVVNNLSEVFNRMILDVRGKPVITMFDGIRKKVMVRNDDKRTGAAKARWEICPTYAEIIEENKRWSRMYRSNKYVDGLWEVTNGTDKTYAVNLNGRTCGCKRWDLSGIPCSRAISAIYKAFQHPEDFVSDFFKKPMYMEAYNPVIYPVLGEDSRTKTDTPDIDPPVFKISLGRSQTKRRKGKFEVPEPKQTSRMASITCSNYGNVGHRYTNCGVPLNPSLQMRKSKHRENREAPTPTVAHAPATAPTAHAPAPPAAPAPTPPVAPPAGRAPTAKKKAAAAPSATGAATAKKKVAAAPSATRAAVAKKKTTPASATSAPTGAPAPFRAPRQAQAPATTCFTTGMPGRERKESSRMKGYLTASNIDRLTLEDIKKGK
ncbi:hypothetical protein ACQ4PT_056048 [Festuca glaucescens]